MLHIITHIYIAIVSITNIKRKINYPIYKYVSTLIVVKRFADIFAWRKIM
jgi:hypothetical protein